ncbi:sphingomyelin phosphodiesterase [Staphylococcus pseudintermedius]|nr:sphingomyelin phosphodiesterase [Staphylococcus pseudintermedius]EGQ3467295.1 sphingomyelin phosphodiesterase [Staphylococcus pseudintermedius]
MKKLKQKKRLTSLLLATTMLLGIMNTGVSHAASDENQAELKLATHNVYMLSGFLYPNWGQSKRADLISKSKYIQDNDVVIFNEAFYPASANQLFNNLKSSYPYQTAVLGRSTSGWDRTEGHYSSTTFENGGVAIVSKYPIRERIQHIFQHGCGFDNDSNKGFVYTKIEKNGKFVHVIGTHTQSEDTRCSVGQDRAIRAEQMKEISNFVKRKNIPKDEVVYIGGDMNVNKNAGNGEFQDMLKNLNVSDVTYTGHSSTWDPQSNSIAKYNYPNSAPEYLDYIFVDKDHRQPGQLINEAVAEKSPTWDVYKFPYLYVYNDYSDHYPVKAYSKS